VHTNTDGEASVLELLPIDPAGDSMRISDDMMVQERLVDDSAVAQFQCKWYQQSTKA
jgi:hypothetical protein